MLDARRLRGEEERWGKSAAPPIRARRTDWWTGDGSLVVPYSGSCEVERVSRRSGFRSKSIDRSAEAAQGELAAEDGESAKEAPWLWRRGGTPEAGSESARRQVGVPKSEVEAAEKEKVGSLISSSVEGSTKSSNLSCSLVDCRVILRFFWEDVVKASCQRSSRNAWSVSESEKVLEPEVGSGEEGVKRSRKKRWPGTAGHSVGRG